METKEEKELKRKMQLLADAVHSILVIDGVLAEDSNPTCPELLLAVEEYEKSKQ